MTNIVQIISLAISSQATVGWSGPVNEVTRNSTIEVSDTTTERMNQTASMLVAHRISTPYHFVWDELKHSIDLNLSFRIVFYAIYLIIFALGIFGNLLVCWVVFRQKPMHTVTNILIANLSLSDVLLCVFCVPFTPLYLLVFKEWVFGSLLCHLVPFFQGMSVYISVFTLMSIAIERYSVIVHPFRSPITVSSCIVIICFIWIFSFILTLPYGIFMQVFNVVNLLPNVRQFIEGNETQFGSGSNSTSSSSDQQVSKVINSIEVREYLRSLIKQKVTDGSEIPQIFRSLFSSPKLYCDEMWPGDSLRVTFGACTTVIQFLMPFCIITFCYAKVCARLWDRLQSRPGSRNCSSQRKWLEKERARRTNLMLIWMVIIFVISWLPISAYNLIEDIYGQVANWPHSKTLFVIFHLIAMASSIYNPLLYAWLNDNFRKEFKSIFFPLTSRLSFLIFGRADSTLDQSKELRLDANNVPRQSTTGKKMDGSTNANGKNAKNCTFTTDLKGSDRKDAGNGEVEISMTVLDTTTNLVTNLESINEIELQESLLVTSVRNGIYANRILPASSSPSIATNKL